MRFLFRNSKDNNHIDVYENDYLFTQELST